MYETIEQIINAFFDGETYFATKLGHVWVATHGIKKYNYNIKGYASDFETLTIEPREGGQYEIAVRIWSEGLLRGYKINKFDASHYLVGINTRGH